MHAFEAMTAPMEKALAKIKVSPTSKVALAASISKQQTPWHGYAAKAKACLLAQITTIEKEKKSSFGKNPYLGK